MEGVLEFEHAAPLVGNVPQECQYPLPRGSKAVLLQ